MTEITWSCIAWLVVTVALGLVTTWTLLACVLVAAAVVFFGVFIVSFADDGDGDWL